MLYVLLPGDTKKYPLEIWEKALWHGPPRFAALVRSIRCGLITGQARQNIILKEGLYMPKRERYSIVIKCPKCNREGTAVFGENENPAHNNMKLDTTLETIPENFTVEEIRKGDFQFRCKECNTLTQ